MTTPTNIYGMEWNRGAAQDGRNYGDAARCSAAIVRGWTAEREEAQKAGDTERAEHATAQITRWEQIHAADAETVEKRGPYGGPW
jgi:hypothetical protein